MSIRYIMWRRAGPKAPATDRMRIVDVAVCPTPMAALATQTEVSMDAVTSGRRRWRGGWGGNRRG